ncbi:MAG TPA: PKD domain-containing protein, partial [Thermoplasmatales archaeon]|nr:PKD domain-containing protein [Thermoplasmatales archaeon]
NLIYNNYFNNTNNAYDDGTNTWNISKTTGRNIVGGPYLGGNYWSDYSGVDTNGDKLGDTSLPYNSSGNIVNGGDFLPLIINNPPVTPYAPSPSNGSTGVSITTDISWQCYDPDGDDVTYDVYFGTTNPPPKVSANQTSKTYDPGTLSYSKTYYWRIVAWDETGLKTVGPLWHFTTQSKPTPTGGAPSPNNPPVADADGPYYGSVGEEIQFDASGSYDPDGDELIYIWEFGDGTTGTGVAPVHTYDSAGVYTVRLSVSDGSMSDISYTTVTISSGGYIPPQPYDSDGDGYPDEMEESYGTDETDPSSYPEDTDGDGIPDEDSPDGKYTGDTDDDNDGLTDDMEEMLGTDPENETDFAEVTIETTTDYLVDTDGDGVYDTFYDPNTNTKTSLTQDEEGNYLIDADGDGNIDYTYNPISGAISPYTEEQPSGGAWPVTAIVVIGAIIVIAAIAFFYKKRHP